MKARPNVFKKPDAGKRVSKYQAFSSSFAMPTVNFSTLPGARLSVRLQQIPPLAALWARSHLCAWNRYLFLRCPIEFTIRRVMGFCQVQDRSRDGICDLP